MTNETDRISFWEYVRIKQALRDLRRTVDTVVQKAKRRPRRKARLR